jgi:hypothetical protein
MGDEVSHLILFDGGPVGGLELEYDDDQIPLPQFREMLYRQEGALWFGRYRYGATASPAEGEYRSNYLYDGFCWVVPYAYP